MFQLHHNRDICILPCHNLLEDLLPAKFADGGVKVRILDACGFFELAQRSTFSRQAQGPGMLGDKVASNGTRFEKLDVVGFNGGELAKWVVRGDEVGGLRATHAVIKLTYDNSAVT